MTLYTLKECFEATGSKFPFLVYWHAPHHDAPYKGIYKILKKEEKNDDGNIFTLWHHAIRDDSISYFSTGLADQKHFDYKFEQYKQDFEELLK